jgi:hypothetical protein
MNAKYLYYQMPINYIYQMPINYIYQMAIKYQTLLIPKPSKLYPNWYFWYAKIPSGNPGLGRGAEKDFLGKFRATND